jgi:hypothetical protein
MIHAPLWIKVCYSDPVVVNHVCYTEPNSCESCCFILSRLCLSHGVSCRAVGYEWQASVVVNYAVFCGASGLESWCVMLNQWLWIMVSLLCQWLWKSALYKTTWFATVRFSIAHMIHNLWVSITHHDSQTLAQHYTPWLTATRISIAQHDSPSHAQHNTPWVILNLGEFNCTCDC